MVLLSLVFASALLFCLPLQAQEIPRPREGVINSSGSGQLKVVTYEVMNAQATVVMLPEGSWNIGSIDPTSGMLTGTNFFIRTIPMFLAQKFNVVTMHRPENVESLHDARRQRSNQHDLRNAVGGHQPLAHHIVDRKQKHRAQHQPDTGKCSIRRNGGCMDSSMDLDAWDSRSVNTRSSSD